MAIDISEDYYLINFEQLIQFVSDSYADLLSTEERSFYTEFTALPENARRLYIRLLCRSRNEFRADKLNYPEINDIDEAITTLQSQGFFGVNELSDRVDSTLAYSTLADSVDQWLPLFTKLELLTFSSVDPALSQFKNQRRDKLVSYLTDTVDPQVLHAIVSSVMLLTVKRADVFLIYRLCFFGNLYQDMTDFVLRDLGVMVFEDYPITSENRAFQHRSQIDAHLLYYRKLDEAADLLDAAELPEGGVDHIEAWCDTLPTTDSFDQTLKRRVDRLRNRVARQLERLDQPECALRLYAQSDYPPARERRARLYSALNRYDESLQVCADMVANPLTDAESEFAREFSHRVTRRANRDTKEEDRATENIPGNGTPKKGKGLPGKHQPITYTITLPHPQTVVLDEGARPPTVEQLCAAHFSEDGLCLYTENTLFNAVTGMVFWDCMFAPVQGAFYNPFQVGPADFADPGFYRRRQSLIEAKLQTLNSISKVAAHISWCLEHKVGRANPLVQWRYLSSDLLTHALDTIPLDHWLAIFKRILKDPKHNRSGLPDLIHFPAAGGYCLVEVKGPGDRLQKNQLAWMTHFAEHGIPHQLCHVVWATVPDNSPGNSPDNSLGDAPADQTQRAQEVVTDNTNG